MRKKIAIVLPTLPVYRKEFFELLNEKLADEEVEFVVFHGTTRTKIVKSARDIRFAEKCLETTETRLPGCTVTRIRQLAGAVKKYRPDGVIFLFNPAVVSFWQIRYYCIRKKIPYGVWSCGYVRPELSEKVKRLREKILLHVLMPARVHICYGHLYERYLAGLGIAPDKIVVAQNTIHVEKILSSAAVRSRFPEKGDGATRVLYVGALIKNKKLEAAMLAVQALRRKGYSVRFTIVGGGKILDELKKFAATHGMNDYIVLTGPEYGEKLVSYFAGSDVFLLSGSGGLAVNEAMAYGLPVISTVGDGTISDLIDGNGFLLRAFGDVEEIAGALEKFIRLPEEVKRNMQERSRQIVRQKASLNRMTERYKEACLKLLGLSAR